jgi:hypothetical protein
MGCTVTTKINLIVFYLFTLTRCTFRQVGALVGDVQQNRCDLFGAYNYIIKYGDAFKH